MLKECEGTYYMLLGIHDWWVVVMEGLEWGGGVGEVIDWTDSSWSWCWRWKL